MFHLKTYLMKICFFMCLTFFCGIINMVEDIYGRKQTFCLILNFKREDMMIKGYAYILTKAETKQWENSPFLPS